MGLVILLGIIYGPLFLFSNLNPTQVFNPVTSASIGFGIQMNEFNIHTLYSNSIMSKLDKVDKSYGSKDNSEFIKQLKSQQKQHVQFDKFSEKYWDSTSQVKKNI